MPNSIIDLRERFAQAAPTGRKTLSPAAQCTVLYHLLREPLAAVPLKDIARRVHYSPMMLTNVKAELEAAGICQSVRLGRATVLDFTTSGRSLWKRVEPALASPVKKTRWIRWKKSASPALLAGMSALSLRTMIADDRLPTYALSHSAFEGFLERNVCTGCPDAENASARMEVWSYNPQLLSDDRMVDPLSLYLSLRHLGDERVQQQLEQLIKRLEW